MSHHVKKYMCLILLVVFTTLFVNKTLSHTDGAMVYPEECCSGDDCAPVTSVTTINGVLITSSRFGDYSIPSTLKRHDSTDSRIHVCIRKGEMICVFFPGAI